jgi:hypothetical protein
VLVVGDVADDRLAVAGVGPQVLGLAALVVAITALAALRIVWVER